MRLPKDHLAMRFLDPEDYQFLDEGMQVYHGKGWDKLPVEKIAYLYSILSPKPFGVQPMKNYYITNTVLDKLDMLKVKRVDEHFDWMVFKNIPPQKTTFVLPDKSCLRIDISHQLMKFLHIAYRNKGTASEDIWYVSFYADFHKGVLADHFNHKDVLVIEEFIYRMLCFFFLSENIEEIVQPGKTSTGTRKQGKFINDLQVPLIIVTSKWNVTSIRNEGFNVSGHFRLQKVGPGLIDTKMIFIEPFEKHGYIRKAKNETVQ